MFRLWLALLAAVLTAGAGAQTITFATWGGTEELDIYAELISEFEVDTGITVNVNHIPSAGDYEQTLATLIAAGNAPDVFFINNISLPGFAVQDAFLPLTPYLEEIDLGDFFEGHLEAFQYQGEQVAIPRDISNMVVFYNADMFRGAGLELPTSDWTWDDFLDKARALTVDRSGDGEVDQFGFGYNTFWLFWQPWIWSGGGSFFSDDHSELTLNQGASLEALEFFVGLRCEENVAPTAAQAADRTAASMFADGDVAMITDGRWRVAPLNASEAVDFEWDVVTFPHGPAGSIVDANGSGWGISSTSQNPDAAWQFIEFVASAEAQTRFTEEGLIIPARRSVGITEAFVREDVPPANDLAFIEANETARPTETFEGWGEFLSLMNEGLSEVWLCNVSPSEGLDLVADEIEDILLEYR